MSRISKSGGFPITDELYDKKSIIKDEVLEASTYFLQYLKTKDEKILNKFISLYRTFDKDDMVKVIDISKSLLENKKDETQNKKVK